jgi:hypothetical protein
LIIENLKYGFMLDKGHKSEHCNRLWDYWWLEGKMKGKIVWVSSFLSFLAGLHVFNAVLLLTLHGNDFLVEFSLAGLVTLGGINAEFYLWLSILATFMFVGLAIYFVYRGLPAEPDVVHRLTRLETSLAINTNMLENTQMGFFRRLEENEKVTDEAFKKVRMDLEETRTDMNGALERQTKALDDVQKESSEKAEVIKKQARDVTAIKKRIVKIENDLSATTKNAKLTSRSKLDAVGDVKPKLARGLRNLGIKTVGQFLTMDPIVIAEKTMEPPDSVTSLQSKAQLLMIPGLTPNDAELLVKVGINSRKELANQDPIELCRTLVGIANVYVERGTMSARQVPTIEDVWSWIKLSQP